MTEEQLRNLGRKSFEEIVAKMQEYGISFKTKRRSRKRENWTTWKRQQEYREVKEKSWQEHRDARKKKKQIGLKTELQIELEKRFKELFGDDEEQQEETEKIDNVRAKTEKNETETTTEIKIETQETVVENNDQQQEKMNFEDMTPEQLQDMIEQNQKIIESNEKQIKEDTEKSKLIQKLLEQQQTIDAQQDEISRLRKLLGIPQQ